MSVGEGPRPSLKPKTTIKDLVDMRVKSDLNLAEQEQVLYDKGLIDSTWENPT